MTMEDWERASIKKDNRIYNLLLPYYDFDYKMVCDRLYSYSHGKKYLRDSIRLYHYLVLTCGRTRYKIQGTDLVSTTDIIFNPLKDGYDLLHTITRLLKNKKTKSKICKLLDNDHKEYIYKNAIIKEMNNTIKKECGIDIIKLYAKRRQILLDFEYGRDKYVYKVIINNGKWIYKKILNPNRRKSRKKVMV